MKTGAYIDFHAHHPAPDGETFVIQDGVQTRGRHPWHLLPPTSPASPASPTSILAIGESGLDRLCDTPYDLQLRVFSEEVRLSEQLRKPLFLHCVRAIDDVLCIRRQLHARQPIIWHGYRGNARQIHQLLASDGVGPFYFSLGFHFRTEALQACPPDRLLLETDEDPRPVSLLYAEVARQLSTPLESLILQMQRNFHTLFG